MKTILWILGGLLVCGIALFLFFKIFGGFGGQSPSPIGTSTVILPGDGDQTNPIPTATSTMPQATLSVRAIDGGYITVNDFTQDPSTEKDPTNDGYYYLAGGSIPAVTKPPYQIAYTESDQSFNTVIYDEPIGQYRKQAEQELMQKLGINEGQMCRLNYWVATMNGLNPRYDATNLGFSFCPGATQL